jgi:hypothetical protein
MGESKMGKRKEEKQRIKKVRGKSKSLKKPVGPTSQPAMEVKRSAGFQPAAFLQ